MTVRHLQLPDLNAAYVTSADHAAPLVAQLLAEPILGIDCETCPPPLPADHTLADPELAAHARLGLDPLQGRLRLVQLAAPDGRCLILDAFALGAELAAVLAPLRSVELVAHNALFDWRWLVLAGFVPDRLHCSAIMFRAARSQPWGQGGMISLADAVRDVLGLELDKDRQASDWAAPELSDSQLAYAARDPLATVRLAVELQRRIGLAGSARSYGWAIQALPHVARMMLRGMPVDWDRVRELSASWAADRDLAAHELAERWPDMNFNSSPQLSAFLEDHLQGEAYKRWPRTRTDRLKTDRATLEKHGAHLPILDPLRRMKAAAKRITLSGMACDLPPESKAQPLDRFRHARTGRVHADFRLGLTDTGRMSCEKPPLQQQPGHDEGSIARDVFTARPGHRILSADLGQVELRIAAALSGDHQLAQVLSSGADLHRSTAARTLAKLPEAVTGDERFAAKRANFGSLYGITRHGLAAQVPSLSESDAQAFLETMRASFPVLAAWLDERARLASLGVPVRTLGGLSRAARTAQERRVTNWARNHPIQGSAADLLCAWLARLPAHCPIIALVHDELVLECETAHAEAWASHLAHEATQAWLELFPNWPELALDLIKASSGQTWQQAK